MVGITGFVATTGAGATGVATGAGATSATVVATGAGSIVGGTVVVVASGAGAVVVASGAGAIVVVSGVGAIGATTESGSLSAGRLVGDAWDDVGAVIAPTPAPVSSSACGKARLLELSCATTMHYSSCTLSSLKVNSAASSGVMGRASSPRARISSTSSFCNNNVAQSRSSCL